MGTRDSRGGLRESRPPSCPDNAGGAGCDWSPQSSTRSSTSWTFWASGEKWFPSRVVSWKFSSWEASPPSGVDLLPHNLLNVLDARELRSLVEAEILGVLVITREVISCAPLTAFGVGAPRSERWWRRTWLATSKHSNTNIETLGDQLLDHK